ncbi:MAG: GNAT family N-acetyltransferase [Candidatus Stygibacter frigidus]|nr:GNAT family N-acetyltransferase [Candidatus Stygibacter frigidus]
MDIRKLSINDYDSFRSLRQCHLETDPQSVSTSAKDWRSAPREKIEALLIYNGMRTDDFILGAFSDEKLLGMIGFKRETRKPSTMHKGMFWGFFVRPERRNKGIGKALVEKWIFRLTGA